MTIPPPPVHGRAVVAIFRRGQNYRSTLARYSIERREGALVGVWLAKEHGHLCEMREEVVTWREVTQ